MSRVTFWTIRPAAMLLPLRTFPHISSIKLLSCVVILLAMSWLRAPGLLPSSVAYASLATRLSLTRLSMSYFL